jgi:hypothetical protein
MERTGMAKRKRRTHSAKQLAERPLTLIACAGPVVVTTVKRGGVHEVQIEFPADVPVLQPPRAVAGGPRQMPPVVQASEPTEPSEVT